MTALVVFWLAAGAAELFAALDSTAEGRRSSTIWPAVRKMV
jgi:hypothetical protein